MDDGHSLAARCHSPHSRMLVFFFFQPRQQNVTPKNYHVDHNQWRSRDRQGLSLATRAHPSRCTSTLERHAISSNRHWHSLAFDRHLSRCLLDQNISICIYMLSIHLDIYSTRRIPGVGSPHSFVTHCKSSFLFVLKKKTHS